MATINLSFPDQSYSDSNLPSVTTLKSDLTAIETAINALDNNNIAVGANIDGDKIEASSATNRGTASFDEDSYTVTAGDVKPQFLGFRAYLSSPTAYNNNDTIICDFEVTDIGGNYDDSTGQFTAPVDGYYYFYSDTHIKFSNYFDYWNFY